jgi:hypothetical protein
MPLMSNVSPIRRSMRAAIHSSASPCSQGFQAFWPPALVQQAPPAIILAALRYFVGSALLRGLRPSPRAWRWGRDRVEGACTAQAQDTQAMGQAKGLVSSMSVWHNPSVKGTPTSGLRPLAVAPYVER